MVMSYDITERDKHLLCNGLEPEVTKSPNGGSDHPKRNIQASYYFPLTLQKVKQSGVPSPISFN